LALVGIASGLIAVGAIVAVDPDVPFAIGVVIAAVAVCAGAVAAALQLSLPLGETRRRQRPAAPALRRGIEVTAIVGLLLLLRVVDGLTVITGGFIIAGFLVAEVVLSARPSRASR
jgi:hypothetical protein